MSEATSILTAESQMQGLILASFQKLEADGVIALIVEKNVKDTMERAVRDALGSFSGFSKSLEQVLKEKAQINFSSLDLPSFGAAMLQLIERTYMESMQAAGLGQAEERLRELLGTEGGDTIKLSSLVKSMRKDHNGEEWEEHKMTLDIDDRGGCVFIGLDPEERKERYRCQYRLTLWKNDVGSYTIKGVEVAESSLKTTGGLSLGVIRNSLERLLVNAYMRGLKLDLDCDEDCEHLYFGNND